MRKILLAAVAACLYIAPTQADAAPITMYKEPPFQAYKVTRGDSFYFIAQRYGLDYRELMRLNPQVDPLNMQIGSTIQLKAAAGSPGSVGKPVGSLEAEVADLVNQERTKRGLKPLELREDLVRAAETKSKDMNDRGYFSHQSPTYGSPFDMLQQFGISYRTAGENIAKGQRSAAEVMQSWMNSSGHRQNILNPQYDSIGVGEVNSVWTQLFTGGK